MTKNELSAIIADAKMKSEQVTLYFICRQTRRFEDDYELDATFLTGAGCYTDKDKALSVLKERACESPEFGTYYKYDVWSAKYDAEELLDIVEEELYDDLDELCEYEIGKIIEAGKFKPTYNEIYVEYQYESIDGDLLVVWEWEKHVGYARKFRELRYGQYYETEEILIENDMVYSPNVSIVATRAELEWLSDEEKRQLIKERIYTDRWKWCNAGLLLDSIEKL